MCASDPTISARCDRCISDGSRRHDNEASEISVRHEGDSLSGNGRPGGAVKTIWRRSFFLQGDRFMTRTSSLAWVLLGLCLSRQALADKPTTIPRVTTPQVYQAVDRASKYLQTESAAWLNTRKCAACHHAPMPLWALSEADRQGYTIDKKYVADTFESLLGTKEKLLASRIFPNPADPPDPRPSARGLN